MKIVTKHYVTGDSIIIPKEERQNWRLRSTVKEYNLITYYYEESKNNRTEQGDLFGRELNTRNLSTTNTRDSVQRSKTRTIMDDRIGQMGNF